MARRKKRQKSPWKVREESLGVLGYERYEDYLKSPLWRSIKARRHRRKGGRLCSFCQSKATQLHHNSYDLKTMAGQKLEALLPCCGRCHGEGSRSDKGWILRPTQATSKMWRLAEARAGLEPRLPKKKRRPKPPKKVSPERVRWIAECDRAVDDLKNRQRQKPGKQSGGVTDQQRRKAKKRRRKS